MIVQSIISGIVATAILDLWQRVLQATVGIPVSNWAIAGRWFAYLPRRRCVDDGIRSSSLAFAAHIIFGIGLYPGAVLAV